MPEVTVTEVSNVSATPASGESVSQPMVTGKLRRDKGRAVLILDVSPLHAYLDTLGVQRDTAYKRFTNAPASRADFVDSTNHVLVPKALCSFDYNAKDAQGNLIPGTLEIDLLRHYQTPPTEPTLRQIAESVKDAAIAVVTHYQPVEISISIVGKKPR